LPTGQFRILAINPGSTSTKCALFTDDHPDWVKHIRYSDDELAPYRGRPILEQQSFRLAHIESALGESELDLRHIDAVVARGGLLSPILSGTYLVNERMLQELRLARRGQHASNLGAFLAHSIADKTGVAAYVVDPVSVDEWQECARFSGSALLQRQCLSHALNTKAVAKRFARESGRSYESLRLVIAHLGSGISVSAHENGLMVDVTNSREEGAFSADRAGGVPSMQLVELCFSGRYSQKQVEELLFGEGGLYGYLGTKDLVEVERRIIDADRRAHTVFSAMVYQIAKEIGAMATVLCGKVDALVITGGMAHSQRLVDMLSQHVRWIAPIAFYPGEDELQALAEGALRVLRQEEEARAL
jgi:butyrate kinase